MLIQDCSISSPTAPTSNITEFPSESWLAPALEAGVSALGAAFAVAAGLPVARVASLSCLRLLNLVLFREGAAAGRHLVPHSRRL